MLRWYESGATLTVDADCNDLSWWLFMFHYLSFCRGKE